MQIGIFAKSKWPRPVLQNIEAIESLCTKCLPDGDVREILLFVALKIHSDGPFSSFLRNILKSRDIVVESHNSNLASFLLKPSVIPGEVQEECMHMKSSAIYDKITCNQKC